MSKYQIPPYYGHHSSVRFRRWRRVAVGGGGGGVGCGADCGAAWLRLPGVSGRPAIGATARLFKHACAGTCLLCTPHAGEQYVRRGWSAVKESE